MEELAKLLQVANLSKFNFNQTVSMPIDNNVNIKKILNICSYVFDKKVECGNGKAIISGKIGIKVLYLDTDNMTNTVSDTLSFSETFLEPTLTADTYLSTKDLTITNEILSADGNLKINCEISIKPIAYLNLGLSNHLELNNNIVVKKNQVNTHSISEVINTSFDHNISFELKNKINKILFDDNYLSVTNLTCENGYIVVEGKIVSTLIYESNDVEENLIKTLKDVNAFKCDVEVNGVSKDSLLDLNFELDRNLEELSTEVEDNLDIVNIKNVIKVCGVVLKPINVEVVDDLFSVENEVECTTSRREYTRNLNTYSVSEIISNEVSLSDDEPVIDEVVSNLNQTAEITNTYIKNDTIFVEGVIASNLIYVDENKELKNKKLEVPFIINTKINTNSFGCVNSNISVLDSKIKVKRGSVIEVEYSLYINLNVYQKETYEIVDSLKLGKMLDFSKYDYQIFVAKQGETSWNLCKRIKICPEDLVKLNKNLPLVMEGGEKVIIKR